MKLPGLQSLNFYFEFFEKGTLPTFYKGYHADSPEAWRDPFPGFRYPITLVNCIPPYLNQNVTELRHGFGHFSLTYRKGYLADISGFQNLEAYLLARWGNRKLKKFQSGIRKLHTESKISFRVFKGDVPSETFKNLMRDFRHMMKARFRQKQARHAALGRWDAYQETLYGRLLEEKASIFVLYDDDRPIGMALNYHSEGILDGAFTTFDIAYSRYGIGIYLLIKKLEWCFENDCKLFDMRWGNQEHIKRLANRSISYQNHVVYKTGNPFWKVYAFLIAKALTWKNARKSI